MFSENNGITENKRHSLSFNGSGTGYFSIWLVNILLTAITLGVFLPWALVRSRRYFYTRTELAGQRFAYHATGKSILGGWLCIAILYVIFLINIAHGNIKLSLAMLLLFILFFPWLMMQGLRYQAMMTSLNNVRFNFQTNPLRAWWVLLGQPLAMTVALSVVGVIILKATQATYSPVAVLWGAVFTVLILLTGIAVMQGVYISQRIKLVFNHFQYGNARFAIDASIKRCTLIALTGMVLFLPFIFLAGYLMASPIMTMAMVGSDEAAMALAMGQFAGRMALVYFIYLAGVLACYGYTFVTLRNYLYGQLSLNGTLRFHSTARVGRFLWLAFSGLFVCGITAFLAWPWARVRMTRYLLENTHLEGDLATLPPEDHNEQPAKDPANLLARGLSVAQFVF